MIDFFFFFDHHNNYYIIMGNSMFKRTFQLHLDPDEIQAESKRSLIGCLCHSCFLWRPTVSILLLLIIYDTEIISHQNLKKLKKIMTLASLPNYLQGILGLVVAPSFCYPLKLNTNLEADVNWINPLGLSLCTMVTIANFLAGSIWAPLLTRFNSTTKVVSFSGTYIINGHSGQKSF